MRIVRIVQGAAVVLGVVALGASPAARGQALVSFTGGILYSSYASDGDTTGWKFSTSSRFVITHLGFWDGDFASQPMVNSHPVGLWDTGGTLLTSNVVFAASPMTGAWRYEPTPPIVLPVGTYHLGAYYLVGNPGSDGYMAATTSRTMAPGFTMLATLRDPDGAQPGLVFPTIETAVGGRYGPNLLFESPAPAITLEMTVATDGRSAVCGSETDFALPPGSDVFPCYLVHNTGNAPLTRHDLVDSYLGAILSAFPYVLAPGGGAYLAIDTVAPAGGPWTSTWTAYNPGPYEVTSAGDEIGVTQLPPLLECNGPTVTFSAGMPAGITSFDALAWPSHSNSPTDFWDLAACGEAGNWTGARGEVACASNDLAPVGPYDTELRTHAFDLSGRTTAAIGFTMNYQNVADELTLDVSLDGGETWQLMTALAGPVGPYRGVGGERFVVELDSAGEPSVRVRWRYTNSDASPADGYVQIDNIAVTCDGGLFFDGFESGDTHAWTSAAL